MNVRNFGATLFSLCNTRVTLALTNLAFWLYVGMNENMHIGGK